MYSQNQNKRQDELLNILLPPSPPFTYTFAWFILGLPHPFSFAHHGIWPKQTLSRSLVCTMKFFCTAVLTLLHGKASLHAFNMNNTHGYIANLAF